MIWQIIIIVSAVVLIFILAKKMPTIIKLNYPKFDLPKINFPKISKDKMPVVDMAQKNVEKPRVNKVNNSFNIFNKPNREDVLFDEADKLFKAGKLEEAERSYLKIATANPQNVKVYNRLGIIYMEKKNFRDAKEAFIEAIRLDPKKASRHYNLAMAQVELREYRNAVESLQHALSLDNNARYKKLLFDLKNKIKYRYKEMKRIDD